MRLRVEFTTDFIGIATKWALFLFPIGLVTVRHWASGFFILLVILGLISLRKNLSLVELKREEKVVILLFMLWFVSFLLSATANGWEYYHVRHIEDEIRFLLFAPLYLLVRRVDGAMKYLVQGSVLGIFVTFGVALYEVFELGLSRASGAYGPLRIGPIVCVMVFIVINGLRLMGNSRLWRSLLFVSIPLGLYASYLSVTRTSYVLVIVLFMVTILLQLHTKKLRAVMLVSLVLIMYASYQQVPDIKYNVDRVVVALDEIGEVDDIAGLKMGGIGNSTKHRIAMWYVSYEMFFDNMLLGVGRGGYSGLVKEYRDSGRISSAAAVHTFPHNMFAEQAVSYGLIGLSIMLSLIGYIFYIAFKRLRVDGVASENVAIIMVSFIVIGMFEGSITINGGYIAFLLVYLGGALSDTFTVSV